MSATAKGAAPELDRNLGFRIAAAGRRLQTAADAVLAPLGMGAPAFGVLLRLAEADGLSQAELARRQAVEAPTMCRMIVRLEGDGHVERRRDPHDRRVLRVHLTARGRATVAEGQALLEPHDRRVFAALDDADRRALLDIIGRVAPLTADGDPSL